MVVASTNDDGFPRSRPQNDLFWMGTMDFAAFQDLPSKLPLFASSESEDAAMSGQNQKVVVSRNDRNNFLDIPGFVREL